MSQRDSKSADDDEQELVDFGEGFEETTDFSGGGLDSAVHDLGPLDAGPDETMAGEMPLAEETGAAESEGEFADEEAGEEDGEEEGAAPKKKRGVVLYKPKANVYTMMMLVSFVALLIGSLCLYAEIGTYK